MGKTIEVPFTEWVEVPLPPQDLPFDDGENMDSPWHRANIELLIDSVETRWRGRKDFYTGGNMFVHFDEERARNKNFRGPDFFVALDADHDKPRLTWTIWNENGKYPDFILELLSPSTAAEDLTTKKKVYEKTFRLPEYFCYNPETEQLQGWRLADGHFKEIVPEADGRIWSDVLNAYVGVWHGVFQGHDGVWVRLFEKDGTLIHTSAETEAIRAINEAARAQAEAARAQAEAARAQAEADRAKKAETEAARLQKELDALRQQMGQLKSNGDT